MYRFANPLFLVYLDMLDEVPGPVLLAGGLAILIVIAVHYLLRLWQKPPEPEPDMRSARWIKNNDPDVMYECTCENNGDLCDFCADSDEAQHEYLYSPEWNSKA